jgi:hypothetical protein
MSPRRSVGRDARGTATRRKVRRARAPHGMGRGPRGLRYGLTGRVPPGPPRLRAGRSPRRHGGNQHGRGPARPRDAGGLDRCRHGHRSRRDDWPRCCGSPVCLAVVVRHRSCQARRWSAPRSAGGRACRMGLGRASLLPFPTSPGWRTRRHAFFGIYMHMHVSAR